MDGLDHRGLPVVGSRWVVFPSRLNAEIFEAVDVGRWGHEITQADMFGKYNIDLSLSPGEPLVVWRQENHYGWDPAKHLHGYYTCIYCPRPCPRCDERNCLEDDYLCEVCRYG